MSEISRYANDLVRKVPVLKMPAEEAIPALRILANYKDPDERRTRLCALRPQIPKRTQLNAYVLPSLSSLRLFEGTLARGRVTDFGVAVAQAVGEEATRLLGRHLLGLDNEAIGLVRWAAEHAGEGLKRRTLLARFAQDKLGAASSATPALLDRLTKWAGYLVRFGVIREERGPDGMSRWSVNARHLGALESGRVSRVSDEQLGGAILAAYAIASRTSGTRLYIPVPSLRDQLGTILEQHGERLTDFDLDELLRRVPSVLENHTVSFSPFSGPARRGLKLADMYAGFVSIRPRPSSRNANRGTGRQGGRGG